MEFNGHIARAISRDPEATQLPATAHSAALQTPHIRRLDSLLLNLSARILQEAERRLGGRREPHSRAVAILQQLELHSSRRSRHLAAV